MTKMPKERVIYDNYDLDESYPDKMLKEMAVECGWMDEDEIGNVSDEQLWRWRYDQDEINWDDEKYMLTKFFKGKTVGFFGEIGRWNGVFKGGKIGEFWELFDKAITDCDYIRLYDENGHFYLTCSHHDGTNHFEVKEITKEGEDYLERWEDDWNDKRTEEHCHNQIYKRYSKLPHYAHKVFGCPRIQYEPQSKEKFQKMLNNQATSFYS